MNLEKFDKTELKKNSMKYFLEWKKIESTHLYKCVPHIEAIFDEIEDLTYERYSKEYPEMMKNEPLKLLDFIIARHIRETGTRLETGLWDEHIGLYELYGKETKRGWFIVPLTHTHEYDEVHEPIWSRLQPARKVQVLMERIVPISSINYTTTFGRP